MNTKVNKNPPKSPTLWSEWGPHNSLSRVQTLHCVMHTTLFFLRGKSDVNALKQNS